MEPYRFLEVRVRSSDAVGGCRWSWQVLEKDGKVIETASLFYDTEATALRAGNAVARAIRKQGEILTCG
jgi:hypothetical protein